MALLLPGGASFRFLPLWDPRTACASISSPCEGLCRAWSPIFCSDEARGDCFPRLPFSTMASSPRLFGGWLQHGYGIAHRTLITRFFAMASTGLPGNKVVGGHSAPRLPEDQYGRVLLHGMVEVSQR